MAVISLLLKVLMQTVGAPEIAWSPRRTTGTGESLSTLDSSAGAFSHLTMCTRRGDTTSQLSIARGCGL